MKILPILLVMTLFVGFVVSADASAHTHNPQRYCRTSNGNGWSVRDVKQLIRCAARKWRVSGGIRKALSVARCESGFDEHNYYAGHYGVYQFLRSTFDSAISHMKKLIRRFNLHRNIWNARMNVIAAIKLVHGGGWGPWSCA